jgi:hypothetical protein
LASIASLRRPASEPELELEKLEASPGSSPLELPELLEPLDEPLESPGTAPPSSGVSPDDDVAQPPASKTPTATKHDCAKNV